MSKLTLLGIVAGVALAASTAPSAGAAEFGDRFRYDREAVDKFPPHELSLDLFGTYADRDKFGNSGDHGGGGVGLNYFFTRYLGIGADSYVEEWKAPYRVNGSLILRYPLQTQTAAGLAPYIFGGGGREMKYLIQWTYHGGGGLEFRFNRYTGLFGDARRVFSDLSSSLDYTLVRGGLRLSF
jgi:hypothetical protein